MTSPHDAIYQTRQAARQGWGPSDPLLSRTDQTFSALAGQKIAYINALTYIADEATADDIDTIKKLARVALGREWNRDGTPVAKIEETDP